MCKVKWQISICCCQTYDTIDCLYVSICGKDTTLLSLVLQEADDSQTPHGINTETGMLTLYIIQLIIYM